MKVVDHGENRPLMRWLGTILTLGVCLAVGGFVSFRLGPDFNWDLQNYHLYNPFALLTGRIGQDFMAANIQSYLNPLLDVPFYLSWTSWFHDRPCVTAFLAGLPYGFAIFLCLRIAALLLPGAGPYRIVEVLAAVVIGVTGTVTISEVGTTFNDIPIAVLVLGALLVELRGVERNRLSGLVAGVLLGMAAGLKMTAVIFAPGFVLGVMFARSDWRTAIVAALWFSAGWLLGYVVTGGWWSWRVYQLYGNPIFPMFNHAFHSPWFADIRRDMRFMPHGVLQILFYPFYWVDGERRVAELPMRDPRFAIAYLASVCVVVALWLRSPADAKAAPETFTGDQRKRVVLLLVFFWASFAIWEALFSIVRYALVLELLTGILTVLAFRWICDRLLAPPVARKVPPVLAVLVALISLKVGLPMDWGRMQYTGVPPLVDSRITLPDGATVLVVEVPVAFVLPFVQSEDSSFIGVDGNTVSLPATSPAVHFIQAKLARANGANNWVLTNGVSSDVNELIRTYDLRLVESACKAISQSPQQHVRICPLERRGT